MDKGRIGIVHCTLQNLPKTKMCQLKITKMCPLKKNGGSKFFEGAIGGGGGLGCRMGVGWG